MWKISNGSPYLKPFLQHVGQRNSTTSKDIQDILDKINKSDVHKSQYQVIFHPWCVTYHGEANTRIEHEDCKDYLSVIKHPARIVGITGVMSLSL